MSEPDDLSQRRTALSAVPGRRRIDGRSERWPAAPGTLREFATNISLAFGARGLTGTETGPLKQRGYFEVADGRCLLRNRGRKRRDVISH
jgi:hypothetical protein